MAWVMAKRAPARNSPHSRFPGGIPDDRPRYSRPGPEGPDEAGDVLAGSESPEEKRSRSRDFAGEVVRNTENLFDEVNEVSDLSYKVLHPPEGKAEVPVPAHGPVLESTPHETPVEG